MIRLTLNLITPPALAQANVLNCVFTPQTCLEGVQCAGFEITIDTHHGADAPYFAYEGTTAPIQQVPGDSLAAQSYGTLGRADREIITLFSVFDAIHTRHSILNHMPTAYSSFGRCTYFH